MRYSSSKLSLSTGNPTTNGSTFNGGDHPARGFALGRRHGDSSSHSTKNPFNSMSPSTSSLSSPTTGASSAFGLGSGAFASFGNSKGPKTPGGGGVLDFGSVVGGSTKTPTAEKNYRDLGSKASKVSLTDSKTATHHPLINLDMAGYSGTDLQSPNQTDLWIMRRHYIQWRDSIRRRNCSMFWII